MDEERREREGESLERDDARPVPKRLQPHLCEIE
jgi:hypothetical protein